ncbi:MAG: GNAT family N-acetyltransferase [Saprospiraceae bacterium]|nr:GNAT family N-acetyltransferase [Saprospiraceae bacterium]
MPYNRQMTSTNSNGIEFKNAGLNDMETIQHIAYTTWPVTFRDILPAEQISYMLGLIYNRQSPSHQMLEKRHQFMLIENMGKPLGFTSFEPGYNSEPQLMIHKLYLLPSTQGMGIGTQLIQKLDESARDYNQLSLRLKVYFANTKAIRFYEKMVL